MMWHRVIYSLVCLGLLLLSGCESYDFKVNDKVVYTPQALFRDFEAPDPALRACLEQAIDDGKITSASQLSALNCSHAGIEDLAGLASFPALKFLRLSSNNVRNLVEIGSISALEELYLDDNQVIDPVPLYPLPALRLLDLSGNSGLQCPRRGSFERVETVVLPRHCR